jgi:hypothetical protein
VCGEEEECECESAVLQKNKNPTLRMWGIKACNKSPGPVQHRNCATVYHFTAAAARHFISASLPESL